MPRPFRRPDTDRAIVVLSAAVVVFLIVFALYWARVVLIPVALAVFFTFILSPVVLVLQRRGLGRVLSVCLAMAATVIAVSAVGLVVGRQVAQLTKTLPDNAEKVKQKVAAIKGWVSDNRGSRFADLVSDVYESIAGSTSESPPSGETGKPPTVVVESSPSWAVRAEGFVSPAAEMLGQAAFTFVLLLYMLLRREDLRNRMIRLVGHGRVTTTTKAVDETSRRISRYLLVQFVLNASFGLVITTGLFFMGIDYAPLWGFVAFLMRYVPYIGTWIGVIPPALFTFAVTDGWAMTIMVLVLFLGLELICNNVFEPLLYGSRLGLSEVAQLVAAAFWAFLWGPVGLILSGPLTTCLLVVGKYVPEWTFLNVLLGDEPVLSPRVAFYQRLTARDQDEAAEIVEKELASRPPEDVFDDVLLPALAAVRRDVAEGRLSEDDLNFVTHSVQEFAEEAAEARAAQAKADEARPPAEPAHAEERARVVFIPARDSADHAAAELLARLLDPALWDIEVGKASPLPTELVARLEEHPPSAVVIGSLPPGGLTHTRYLYKRLRQQFPDLKVLIARWATGDKDSAWERFRDAGADEVVTTLKDARTFLDGWRAVFTSSATPPRTDERKAPARAIGTVPA
jgi:predicted PurR-regulated permease PerM